MFETGGGNETILLCHCCVYTDKCLVNAVQIWKGFIYRSCFSVRFGKSSPRGSSCSLMMGHDGSCENNRDIDVSDTRHFEHLLDRKVLQKKLLRHRLDHVFAAFFSTCDLWNNCWFQHRSNLFVRGFPTCLLNSYWPFAFGFLWLGWMRVKNHGNLRGPTRHVPPRQEIAGLIQGLGFSVEFTRRPTAATWE